MAFVTYGDGGKTPESYQKVFEGKDLIKEYSYEELWSEVFGGKKSPLPDTLTSKHRVVIVDADAVVYRTSVACEKRHILAELDGKKKKFKTRTKLKEHCKKVGLDYDSVVYEEVLVIEDIEDCEKSLKNWVAKIHRQLKATHVIFILGGSVNFRHDIKLPTKYKDNRKTKDKPRYLSFARNYLNENYDTYVVTGIEADDAVQGITEHLINNTEAYAAAYQLDKDYHTSMTPNRYWNIDKNILVELTGGIGRLYKTSSGVKGEGLMWVLFQLMLGDPSDGYSPKVLYRDIYKGKYADVSFLNEFKDFTEEQLLLVAWIMRWRELLPAVIEYTDFNEDKQKHNWLSLAEIYFQCLYMRMSPTDDTTFEKLLNRYGVIVDQETGDVHTIKVDLPEQKEIKKEVILPDSEFGFGW